MIPGSALRVVSVVLNSGKPLSLRELSKEAHVPLSRCSRYINELERLGYIRKRPRIKVVNEELVYLIAYGRPLKSLKAISFESLERPQYLIKKIAELAGDRLTYAYTHLAGAELVAPYVVPNELYAYVEEGQMGRWTETFEKNQIYPSDGGPIHLVVSDLNPFYGAREVRGVRVVSNFLLFADLYSCGGREREAAKFLAEKVGLRV
jgi:DNA-binding Lrp family transcriptional regulator